jgi:hypothetical protein
MENKPNLNIDEIVENENGQVVETTEKPKKTKKATEKKECEMEIHSLAPRAGKTWKQTFIDNYNGTSEEAKALQPFLKETYKGDVYIPWAVMERLVYMCDEYAKFTTICNANGGMVHSDILVNRQKNIQKGEVVSETEAPMYAHFVKVALEFMGKVFIEDYPIQDQDYSAAKVFNQNLVNRALQRAKTKVAARATGLGLKLYEGFDLQFDTKEEEKKPTLTEVKEEPKVVEKPVEKKVEKKVELADEQKAQNIVDGGETEAYLNGERTFTTQDVKEEPQTATQSVAQITDTDIKELVDLIKNSDVEKMTAVLQRVNVSIMKKYSFALSTQDTEEQLVEKLSKFPNVSQFKKTIINLLG